MAGTLAPYWDEQHFDSNGDPLNGGLIYTYSAGTVTPLTTYSDAALTVANTNPIVLAADGRCTTFFSATTYKCVLKTAAGVTLRTQDNIQANAPFNINLDVSGTAGEALTANETVALSDGTGGLTAGQWYKADADLVALSSQAVDIGRAVNDIGSGDTGSIRLGGAATASGLTGGLAYYVSATAGGLTSTPPGNRRLVGIAASATSLIMGVGPRTTEILTNLDIVNGRLTLTTALPVTTADVTAATTVYFTPYKGNRIALFDGTSWDVFPFTQLSIALGTDTTSIGYDVFAYHTNGTVAIERLAWTNATTRATALTTQHGVLVKTGDTTRRYLGSYYTTSAGQTEDSLANRMVWNYYNRVPRPMRKLEATDTWSYNTATWRQANGAAGNKVQLFTGVAETPIKVRVQVQAVTTTASAIAVGEDSVTAPTTGGIYNSLFGTAGTYVLGVAVLEKVPAVGFHYYAWLEIGAGSGTSTWYGDDGALLVQSGITGEVMG